MTDAVDIDRLLRDEGFDTPEAAAAARAVLEEQGLTRPGKRNISTAKLPAVQTVLSSAFLRTCGSDECTRLAARKGDGRRPVTVTPGACAVCGGSNNRRAAVALARRLREAGLRRLLIVGGTPTLHHELGQLLGPHGIDLRCVDGATGSHSARDAAPNLQWAEVAVIWGASPLPHKVSKLYTEAPPAHVRIVKFARRGIEALCREVLRSVE